MRLKSLLKPLFHRAKDFVYSDSEPWFTHNPERANFIVELKRAESDAIQVQGRVDVRFLDRWGQCGDEEERLEHRIEVLYWNDRLAQIVAEKFRAGDIAETVDNLPVVEITWDDVEVRGMHVDQI